MTSSTRNAVRGRIYPRPRQPGAVAPRIRYWAGAEATPSPESSYIGGWHLRRRIARQRRCCTAMPMERGGVRSTLSGREAGWALEAEPLRGREAPRRFAPASRRGCVLEALTGRSSCRTCHYRTRCARARSTYRQDALSLATACAGRDSGAPRRFATGAAGRVCGHLPSCGRPARSTSSVPRRAWVIRG